MPKIPEISVGIQMERSVSVSSDRNIRDHSGGGPLISVGIFQPKFAVPFLTNRFFAPIKKFGKGIKSGKSHSYWLSRLNRKMPFHFPRVFPLISDRSVWHNGKHPSFSDRWSRGTKLWERDCVPNACRWLCPKNTSLFRAHDSLPARDANEPVFFDSSISRSLTGEFIVFREGSWLANSTEVISTLFP